MKNELARTMVVEFKGLQDLERDLLDLPKDRTKKTQPKNMIYFDSLSSFRSFMTIQKLEILTLIATAKPKSVYELAKILNRAIAPVQKDCQMLEATGFIELNKEKGGRGNLIPRLTFDYNCILVKMPNYPYELQFNAAA
jgi:predicted transcriptional regulator